MTKSILYNRIYSENNCDIFVGYYYPDRTKIIHRDYLTVIISYSPTSHLFKQTFHSFAWDLGLKEDAVDHRHLIYDDIQVYIIRRTRTQACYASGRRGSRGTDRTGRQRTVETGKVDDLAYDLVIPQQQLVLYRIETPRLTLRKWSR